VNYKIIVGFQGIGKKSLLDKSSLNIILLDQDDLSEDYVSNLMKDDKIDLILIEYGKTSIELLNKSNFKYLLIYPHISLKSDYIRKYKRRGLPEFFINHMIKNWDKLINECNRTYVPKIVIEKGKNISDYIYLF
jgi:hypothetical protein